MIRNTIPVAVAPIRWAMGAIVDLAVGTLSAIENCLDECRRRSCSGGHITCDIAFSNDGRQMFVSVGSVSNDGEEWGL
jgi:glucose/arabinose dehydrogenase